MDYLEIMDFCGYDLDKANEIAQSIIDKETIETVLKDVGLEEIK